MLVASGWADGVNGELQPLYDPCCGSGTIAIEAAQIACHIAAGSRRRFAFEKMVPFQPHVWSALKKAAADAECLPPPDMPPLIYGSDVSHRMVDFAQRNAQRAGVAEVIEFRGGDALQRMPPVQVQAGIGGVMLLNPPYGERIEVAGVAGLAARGPRSANMQRSPAPVAQHRAGREDAQVQDGGDFFTQLASHWKKNYSGWTAWMLTPDLKLPGKMRLKESRRVPMWNGPLECRLFRFDLVAGSMKN
jgi:putative N6-adenine-specific DNA methylase